VLSGNDSRSLAWLTGVLFEDIEIRLLPRACPELNAMDYLFRVVKGRALAIVRPFPLMIRHKPLAITSMC
jgi:hypothetical protein